MIESFPEKAGSPISKFSCHIGQHNVHDTAVVCSPRETITYPVFYLRYCQGADHVRVCIDGTRDDYKSDMLHRS